MIEQNKLNDKLARWSNCIAYFNYNLPEDKPCFTHRLDDCFKWLVPGIEWVGIHFTNTADGIQCDIWTAPDTMFYGIAETPALALCLAIKKLKEDSHE